MRERFLLQKEGYICKQLPNCNSTRQSNGTYPSNGESYLARGVRKQRQLLACSVEKGKGGKPGKPQQPSRNLGEVDKGEAKAPGSLSGHADTGAGGVHRSSDAHLCAAPAAGSAGGQAAGDAGMLHAPEAAAPANVRRDVRPHVHPAHHGHHGVKEVRVFAVRCALALLPDQVLFLHALGARKVASYFFTFVRLEFP
ncbi:hypothetical protein D1007_29372 [Hordeum vulgare]|nr:hypothetical protein D1007_29372 [Hordeum vulgare]